MEREQVREAIVRPNRLLGDESTAKFLEMIQYVSGIQNIVFQGPNCPPRELKVGDQSVELSVTVDSVYMEIENEDVVKDIKAVCNEALACSCTVEYRVRSKPDKMSERAARVERGVGTLRRDL